jgi:mRNA interferase MazF
VFAFGTIVLTRFPFTDLSGDKRRPALVVSRDNNRRLDLIVCFITSVPRTGPDTAQIAATLGTGLKVPSVVRFDKVATLDRSVIAGKLGVAPAAWLSAHRTTFQSVFGFDALGAVSP